MGSWHIECLVVVGVRVRLTLTSKARFEKVHVLVYKTYALICVKMAY